VQSTLKKISKTASGVNYNVTWIVLVALMSFSMSTNNQKTRSDDRSCKHNASAEEEHEGRGERKPLLGL